MRTRPAHFAVALAVGVLGSAQLMAQGPTPGFLLDPATELGFASCRIYFEGGAQRRIPFLPIGNAHSAPTGSRQYSTDIRVNAPIVFVGDGVVRSGVDPYSDLDVAGKVVLLSYDFPVRNRRDSVPATLSERIHEAVRRKAGAVVVFSALQESPFPVLRDSTPDGIPEIPVIAINKQSAASILASDGRNPDTAFAVWEREGKFAPGELIVNIELRINSKFTKVETKHFSLAFQPGISSRDATALAATNERAVEFLLTLFKAAAPQWRKTFTAYFLGYDAKVFFVRHWGRGLSSDAGNFIRYDRRIPDFQLSVHENAHTLISENWGASSSFVTEGIGMYAAAMASDKEVNHQITRENVRKNTLFPLEEMSAIEIGSDPRSAVVYPAAGSFVQFLVQRYSLPRFKEIYVGVAGAGDSAARLIAWARVYGKSLAVLEAEWLASIAAR